MIHFETIWNQAESVSKSYSDLERKEVFKNLRDAVNNLSDSENQKDYHQALGDSLFYLCAVCAFLEEKKGMQINSAIALSDAIDRKRAEFLDPQE